MLESDKKGILSKSFYNNPNIEILYGLDTRIIREFDMNAAGFSVIQRFRMLGRNDIRALSSMDKFSRNVAIGKIRALDTNWSKALSTNIRSVMLLFMEANEIIPEDIVSINNDAVTVIQPLKKKHTLQIDKINFKISGEYTSLLNVNRVYFLRDDEGDLTVKGISDTSREYCTELLSKISEWLGMLEHGSSISSVLLSIQNFKVAYCNRSLPLGYYRDLRNGVLNFNNKISRFSNVSILHDFHDSEWYGNLDMSGNLINFIIPIIGILLDRNHK